MPKLKVLSGKDVIKILESFNFFIAGQKGSHIKLKRTLPDGHSQSLTIPNHKELVEERLKIFSIKRQDMLQKKNCQNILTFHHKFGKKSVNFG